MRADVLGAAIDAASPPGDDRPRFLMSARGRRLDQALTGTLAAGPGVLMIAGRFEGVDERVIEGRKLIEVSIGDYVLAGGEVAAMVLLEAVVRLLPGVMGNVRSAVDDSFSGGLLEYPQYTRPQVWEGRVIPDVLLSGDHARIDAWRRDQARRLTRERRPDLIAGGGRED
jgi:tRNA (guanine37-N1)-methyltransferase